MFLISELCNTITTNSGLILIAHKLPSLTHDTVYHAPLYTFVNNMYTLLCTVWQDSCFVHWLVFYKIVFFSLHCRTKCTSNLCQHIDNIHENYLSQIWAKSEFQGLKYHGGPIAKCNCAERVLPYVSFSVKKGEHTPSSTPNTAAEVVGCDECFLDLNVEELLQSQVS